ncbi:hypothetical protein PCAR4_1340015 [Paraburkholderia caribensis]|nr:hypothetical protein PCAR4_1340015 [Paraburkholderia caribensis]
MPGSPSDRPKAGREQSFFVMCGDHNAEHTVPLSKQNVFTWPGQPDSIKHTTRRPDLPFDSAIYFVAIS